MKQRILVAVVGIPAAAGRAVLSRRTGLRLALLAWHCASSAAMSCWRRCCRPGKDAALDGALRPCWRCSWWPPCISVVAASPVRQLAGLMPWLLAALVRGGVLRGACWRYGKHQELDFTDVCAMRCWRRWPSRCALSCLLRLRMLEHGGRAGADAAGGGRLCSDSAALFAGMACSASTSWRRVVSPKKTVEGAVGGLVGGMLGMVLFRIIFYPVYGAAAAAHRLAACSWVWWARCMGQLGDLSFSCHQAAVRHQGLRTAAAGPRRRAGPVRQRDVCRAGDW